MRKNTFLLLFICLICSQTNAGQKVYQLGKTPVDKIVSAMTLEEKANLLVGGGYEVVDGKRGATLPETNIGAAGMTVRIPRLGIPATVETDGPAGVRISPTRGGENGTFYCTGFPIGTALSSTWNTSMVNEVGKAMGNEVLEYGCDVLLAPGMNLHRNPLCGRNFEYYSEDPLLVGKMAASMVNGVQSQGVGTSIKHFAANNQETFRTENSSDVSQRALRELYLKGFEIAVKEGHPWTVMSSYNKLNGVYTQEDYPLLTTLLRGDWGYKGIVMTDWTGTRNTAAQIHAGDDLLMPGNAEQVQAIISAVKEGKLLMSDVDRNVKNMLEFLMKTPHFRHYQCIDKPDLKAHAAVARKAADEGIVLLKNDDNTLPLKTGEDSIALFGIGSYYLIAGGTGSGDVNKAYVVNLKEGMESAGFGLQSKVNTFYEKYINFEKEEQLNEVNSVRPWWSPVLPNEAVVDPTYIQLRAKDSKVAIISFARNAGEGADRHAGPGDFELTSMERDMLTNVVNAFHAEHKKVIVVLNTGGVVETASWKTLPDAIILAWQPGQEGGNAIADVISGNVDPSGKLPMTFPVNYMDIPSSKNFPYDYNGEPFDANKKDIGYTKYDEGIWVGYRYFNTFDKKVSYPFGYGLSYTTFSYDNAMIKKTKDGYEVSVSVKNTGKVAGKEVAELYISAPKSDIDKPKCELKAFAKTKLLQPEESEVLTLKFVASDLASFHEDSNSWITDTGTYKVLIGSSVNDIRQTLSFKLKNSIKQEVKAKL